MAGTILWFAGSYSLFRFVMWRCRQAAHEGYESQRRYFEQKNAEMN
ncbi:MAG: hypothetical protein HFG20_09870 [Anaerotruncus sp.]|nr:hypothetical protein [Anaerotruncus sp.]